MDNQTKYDARMIGQPQLLGRSPNASSAIPGSGTSAGVNVVEQKNHTFETGAQRGALKPRYDLIPASGLRRLAARFEMGLKYGEFNYKQGLPFDDTLNHIIDHLQAYKERRKKILQQGAEAPSMPMPSPMELVDLTHQMAPDGDDIAAAAWGCFAIMELEEQGRLL